MAALAATAALAGRLMAATRPAPVQLPVTGALAARAAMAAMVALVAMRPAALAVGSPSALAALAEVLLAAMAALAATAALAGRLMAATRPAPLQLPVTVAVAARAG